jgi:hypothetical protein
MRNFYELRGPTEQTAIDIFDGSWSSHLPIVGTLSGSHPLFSDGRIETLLEQFGSIKGLSILELGPLEGGHSYMLEKAGAHVTAIEANSSAYLRCLVSKELLGMRNVNFLFGDFVEFLRNTKQKFDLILASGVLYHMVNPLELLQLCANVSDSVFLWTHYFDDETNDWSEGIKSRLQDKFDANSEETIELNGQSIRVVSQKYLESLNWSGFCGGPTDGSHWMYRSDILRILDELDYNTVTVSHENRQHVNGPSFCVLGRKN